jgi:hypothetical protein
VAPRSTGVDLDGPAPRPALPLLFHLGHLSATPEVLAAARAAGVHVVETVLRHLGGDWGDLDDESLIANNRTMISGGTLRSVYALAGTGDAVVNTTDAERNHTTAALRSQCEPDE